MTFLDCYITEILTRRFSSLSLDPFAGINCSLVKTRARQPLRNLTTYTHRQVVRFPKISSRCGGPDVLESCEHRGPLRHRMQHHNLTGNRAVLETAYVLGG